VHNGDVFCPSPFTAHWQTPDGSSAPLHAFGEHIGIMSD